MAVLMLSKSSNTGTFKLHSGVGKPVHDEVLGVLETIKAENRSVKVLFARIESNSHDVVTRRKYQPLLQREIALHIKLTREVLLPALLETRQPPQAADEMFTESTQRAPLARWQAAQRVVLRKLQNFMGIQPSKFKWLGAFESLQASARELIEEEEQIIFPIAKSLLVPLKLLSLDIRYNREKQLAPSRCEALIPVSGTPV